MSFRRLLGCLASVALATATLGMVTTSSASAALDAHLTRYPYLTDLVTTASGNFVTVNWATDRSMGANGTGWVRLGTPGANGACTLGLSDTQGTKKSLAIGPSDQLPSPPAPTTGTAEYQWTATVKTPAAGTYCYTVFAQGTNAQTIPVTDLLGGVPYPKFTTQVPAGSTQPYSFAVFGDWGEVDQTGQNPALASIMSQVANSGVNFAVTVGDNAYNSGAQDEYGDLQQSTGTTVDNTTAPPSTKPVGLSAVFGPNFWTVPAKAGIPIFPAIGNHGLMRSDSTCLPAGGGTVAQCHPHLMNWPQPTAVSTSGGSYTATNYGPTKYGTNPVTLPDAWYAFNAGNARFYVLETAWPDNNWGSAPANVGGYANDYEAHWAPGAAEVQWLKQDLATHPGGLKFAFFHKPLTSDTASPREATDMYLRSDGPTPNAATDSLEAILANNGVDIAFTGHAHIYERNAPHTGGPSLLNYVTGGGGAQPESLQESQLGQCDSNDMYAIAWSPTKAGQGQPAGSSCGAAPTPTDAGQVFHFLKVTVNGTQVTVTPTNADGHTFDVQTYDFTPTSPPPTNTAGYELDGWGGLHTLTTKGAKALPAPVGAPYWPGWNIARGVALVHDANGNATGGYVLDGWGGLHPFKVGTNGVAPPAAIGAPYWAGWDIARGVSIDADGKGGFVVDGWGGLHPFKIGSNGAMPPAPTGGPYWPGWDIVRGVTSAPGGGGYVLDGWGGLHRFATNGNAPAVPKGGPYWPGWDIARGVTISSGASGAATGYVFDGWGGPHSFGISGQQLAITQFSYWPGWDIVRGASF